MIGILIAEVEPEIAEKLKPHLDEAEFKIISTSDGESALKLIAAESPALVVVDTTLCRLEGLELLGRLRTRRMTMNLPVIVVTSRMDNQPHEEAIQLQANDYFIKPIDPGKLAADIRKILKIPMAA